MKKKLEIYAGSCHAKSLIASCSPDDLLDTLRGPDVWRALKSAMDYVHVQDAETMEYLAGVWYDASTEPEEGEDWGTLSAKMADAVKAALAATS